MCCKGFWKRIVSFALALMLGILTANIFRTAFAPEIAPVTVDFKAGNSYKTLESEPFVTSNVKILSKPELAYCPLNEKGQIRQNPGRTVSVYVTFQANGKIGEVFREPKLSDSNTDEAVRLAKGIKFKPAKRDGVSVTVVEPVAFKF